MGYGPIMALSGEVWPNHTAVMEIQLQYPEGRGYMLKSLYDQLFKVLLLSLLECAGGNHFWVYIMHICVSTFNYPSAKRHIKDVW